VSRKLREYDLSFHTPAIAPPVDGECAFEFSMSISSNDAEPA